MERLLAARDKGLAKAIGVSNFTSAMMRRAQEMAGGSIICNQVEFHPLLDQSRLLATARELGMVLTAYSPLARGVLTGKYKPDADPLEGSRASRQDRRMMQTEWRRESLVMAQDVVAHAKKRGITPGLLQLLAAYGDKAHDHHGGQLRYFSKAARRRLLAHEGAAVYRAIESKLDVYAVITLDGCVVTVGRRDKRITRQ